MSEYEGRDNGRIKWIAVEEQQDDSGMHKGEMWRDEGILLIVLEVIIRNDNLSRRLCESDSIELDIQ